MSGLTSKFLEKTFMLSPDKNWETIGDERFRSAEGNNVTFAKRNKFNGQFNYLNHTVTATNYHSDIDPHFLAGQFKKTIEKADEVLKKNPYDRLALERKGVSCYMTDDFGNMLDIYNRLIELDPGNAAYFEWKANSLIHLGRPLPEVVDALEQAYALKPDSYHAFELTFFYSRTGRTEDAVNLARHAMNLPPPPGVSAEMHQLRCRSFIGDNVEETVAAMLKIHGDDGYEILKGIDRMYTEKDYVQFHPKVQEYIHKLVLDHEAGLKTESPAMEPLVAKAARATWTM